MVSFLQESVTRKTNYSKCRPHTQQPAIDGQHKGTQHLWKFFVFFPSVKSGPVFFYFFKLIGLLHKYYYSFWFGAFKDFLYIWMRVYINVLLFLKCLYVFYRDTERVWMGGEVERNWEEGKLFRKEILTLSFCNLIIICLKIQSYILKGNSGLFSHCWISVYPSPEFQITLCVISGRHSIGDLVYSVITSSESHVPWLLRYHWFSAPPKHRHQHSSTHALT